MLIRDKQDFLNSKCSSRCLYDSQLGSVTFREIDFFKKLFKSNIKTFFQISFLRRFRIYQKNNNFFSNLTPRSHDVHFWRPRVKSNDYSQILPKDAECDCNQYSRKKLTIFFGNLALSGHSKSQKLPFQSKFRIDVNYANYISK